MQQPRVIGAFTELTVHLECVDRSAWLLGLGLGNRSMLFKQSLYCQATRTELQMFLKP